MYFGPAAMPMPSSTKTWLRITRQGKTILSAGQRSWPQRTNATARSHPSVTCSRMLVTPSQCPRAVFRLRANPPVPRRVVHAPLAGGVLTP